LKKYRPVYLDVETTGLDPDRHEIWEIAWAVGDERIQVAQVPHDVRTGNPDSLRVCDYWHLSDPLATQRHIDNRLRALLADAMIIGSNPRFDAAFLLRRWGLHESEAPWHYRLLDVGAYAAGVLGLDHVPGLAEVVKLLN
jgi:DNA polymerase-3 subunit epsilon